MGKDAGSANAALTEVYLSRAAGVGRTIGIEGPSLVVVDAPRAFSGPQRQSKEAALLADAVLPNGPVLLFDERGKDLTSKQFSAQIERHRDDGAGGVTMMIGGADGFSAEIDALLAGRPIQRLAFGRATWPHQLVRVMAAEQLYRAATLLAGHPYHRS